MGMIRRTAPLLLVLSCLSDPTGSSQQRVGVDRGGVRLIGGRGATGAGSACDQARECCYGDPDCLDFIDGLTEALCQDLLDSAPGCGGGDPDGPGNNECCRAGDPCGWEDDGSCDCPDEFWDAADCDGAEGEAEAEPDCCSPSDPCELAGDGSCDCPGEEWEAQDCIVPDGPPPPDAGPDG